MTWKDILRKAPFNIGDAQVTRLNELKDKKKELQNEFPQFLEDFLDDELQQKINHNPNVDRYTVYVKKVADKIKDLMANGFEVEEIEQIMQKEYNAKTVTIDNDGAITFEGVTTLW